MANMANTVTTSGVEVIPATQRAVKAGGQFRTAGHIRVAAYARVSTEEENQQTSYKTQCEHFTSFISSNPDWEFAGMYADEGITGTSRKNRVQFNKMMEDAEAGKFDYIITKSTSRFARNTVDSLTCVRKLMNLNPPVGVFFEEDNLDTLDGNSELLITIKSALAQEESNSISKNIRWSLQKNFQAGIPMVNLKGMIGYDKGPNGEWVINEEQARTVRFIFDNYLNGESANGIAKALNELGWTTVRGNKWCGASVLDVLRNEKFVGDLEMQKTTTESFLTHKAIKNKGQAPRYYKRDHHVGIVDRDTWDRAQARLQGQAERNPQATTEKKRKLTGSAISDLYCGHCGAPVKRQSYRTQISGYSDERSLAAEGIDDLHLADEYAYSYGNLRCTCRHDARGVQREGRTCPSELVNEIAAKQSFMEMIYGLKRDYEANGEESLVAREYKAVSSAIYQKARASSAEIQHIEQLDKKIKDLEGRLETVRRKKEAALEEEQEAVSALGDFEGSGESASKMYAQLEEDICAGITAARSELESMTGNRGVVDTMQRNYELFIASLLELPETNAAGMKLNVNGLDVDGSLFSTADGEVRKRVRERYNSGRLKVDGSKIAEAPDFLDFNHAIYQAFSAKGVVKTKGMVIGGKAVEEDVIEYYTNFGIKLTCKGIGRGLRSFLGFRKCGEDGAVELLTENWQVAGTAIQYRRRTRKYKWSKPRKKADEE